MGIRVAVCVGMTLLNGCLFAQTPEVKAMYAKQAVFRERGVKALAAETVRERHGDCNEAGNTAEGNGCYTREMGITNANYKSYVLALGGMLRLGSSPDETKAAAEVSRKFDASEAAWATYRQGACDTVYQYYLGGTIRGLAYGSCMQRITRSHMHDLAGVYTELWQ